MSAKDRKSENIVVDQAMLEELGVSQEELEAFISEKGGDALKAWAREKEQEKKRKKKRQGDTTKRGKAKPSILKNETTEMDRARRELEQQGHRRFAHVNAREHAERQAAQEEGLQNTALQHPALNNQRFDGIDPNVNPEPAINSEARREFDNERREQDQEKQMRLGNMPGFSKAPKPHGP